MPACVVCLCVTRASDICVHLCMCDVHESCLFPYQQASSFLQFCIKRLLTLLNECKGVLCLMWHCTWNNCVKLCFSHECTRCVWMNPGKWKRSYRTLAVWQLLPSRIIPLKNKEGDTSFQAPAHHHTWDTASWQTDFEQRSLFKSFSERFQQSSLFPRPAGNPRGWQGVGVRIRPGALY